MYKIWFDVYDRNQWYDIIRECKKWFGKEWRGQRGVRRKLDMFHTFHRPCFEFGFWYQILRLRHG